jgi:hypothetical protein
MADRGHGIGGKRPGRAPADSGSAAPEPSDRPGAAGHRFGPRLVCSECGIRWDVHQRDQKPCLVASPAVPPDDPFARRPVLPLPGASPIAVAPPASRRPADPRDPSERDDESS